MQPIIKKYFIVILFLIVAASMAKAQTCTGSLGDPVINQDFGSGSNPATPTTTMTYTTSGCPNDGFYTIANTVGTNQSRCYNVWHILTSDHTGNPNGYMMVINASINPDVFFVQQAKNLCPGTTYAFSAFILNLFKKEFTSASTIQPNVTFSIETPAGVVLATYSTGVVEATSSPTWVQYPDPSTPLLFTVPVDQTDVVVKMTNNAKGGSGNDFVIDDITFRACGPVITTGFGAASGNPAAAICAGQAANYTIDASMPTGLTNPAYQWQANYNDGNGWNDLPGETGLSLNVNLPNPAVGKYQYRLGCAEAQNIGSLKCRVYSNISYFDVNPLPVLQIAANPAVCEGDALQLTASGANTYVWTGPNLPATSQNPVTINNVSLSDAGKYTVVGTSALNCSASASTIVTVNPKVTATVSGDVNICNGKSTFLTAAGGTTYSWTPTTGLSDPASASPVASPTTTTTYTVKVSNATGCFDTKQVTVTVLDKPVADAGGPRRVIFEGQSLKLNGKASGSAASYLWSPSDYLDDPTSLTPIATPPNDITYTLRVTSADNCGFDESSVFVRVYQKIVIPTAFTPNNDGINDKWDMEALTTYPSCLVLVFNRYGQQVFNSIGYGTAWNGTYNGKRLPVGVYYYIIDLKNGTPKLTGWVYIAR